MPSIPLLQPLQTEKATLLAKNGKYLFLVDRGANKISVAQAFEKLYNVKPASVNMSYLPKKTRLAGKGRPVMKRHIRKKALITLPKGKTIDIYKVKEK